MPKISKQLLLQRRHPTLAPIATRWDKAAFPAPAFQTQARKVSFEEGSTSVEDASVTSSSSSSTSSSSASSCCCSSNVSLNGQNAPSRPNYDWETSSTTVTAVPLHRSPPSRSLTEGTCTMRLRRPTTSFCLSELVPQHPDTVSATNAATLTTTTKSTAPLSPQSEESNRESCLPSSPWGHFVDVVPPDCDDGPWFATASSPWTCETPGYVHPDALLFWSRHSSSSRYEPYSKTQRLRRRKNKTLPFSTHEFLLPANDDAPGRMTCDVEGALERLHV